MTLVRWSVMAAGLLLLAGCIERSRFVEKRGALDEGLYYYEEDRTGAKRAISEPEAVDTTEHVTTRVPQPALVDKDSSLRILVSPD